jgi:hypothetical protein
MMVRENAMVRATGHLIAVVALAALGGCSATADSLWPSMEGGSPRSTQPAPAQRVSIAPSRGEANTQPVIGTSAAAAAGPAVSQALPPPPSSTVVGQRVAQLRSEQQRLQGEVTSETSQAQQLRNEIRQKSERYHTTVGAINARLSVGTTPGNPQLVAGWNQAQTDLSAVETNVGQLNQLANQTASTSTLASYLLETTRATYSLSGAVDEDHRALSQLEDEVNRMVVTIDRLLNDLSDDINRQNAYLNNERSNLTALSLAVKNGQLFGTSLANRGFAGAAPAAGGTPAAAASQGASRRPLVVIRFDRSNVQYQQALYNAVSRALERRPSATFDLVAVAPNKGTPAQVTLNTNASKRNAETVLRSLNDMGLQTDRVRLSSMTSTATDTNEVHVYVR